MSEVDALKKTSVPVLFAIEIVRSGDGYAARTYQDGHSLALTPSYDKQEYALWMATQLVANQMIYGQMGGTWELGLEQP